jgi:cathepsin L
MRAVLCVAMVLLVALASARHPRWNQLSSYTFEQYVRDFNRRYDKSEYQRRREVFNANLKDIQKHNADTTQTWKKGVNQFSDWTSAEWKRYNTFRSDRGYPVVESAYTAAATPALPNNVDYRLSTNPRVISAVKNQGACGNCWAHSTAESIESYFAILTGQLPTLSTQQITSCTTVDYGCGGGDYFDGWGYVMNSTGLNEEWVYPFVDFFAANESMQATAPCKNVTKEFLPNFPWFPKAGVTGMVGIPTNEAPALLSALATVGPQSIAVAADLWGSYEGGIYQNAPNNTNNWQIDHAVQLVGYGYDYDVGMDYWIVRNSWGTTWGEAGYIRLARFPQGEPCGNMTYPGYPNTLVCGTSGLLYMPGYPIVSTLSQLNP